MQLRLIAVLVLSLAASLPLLGRHGFWASEGHRAIPALEMAQRGDWLVPTLFEQPYLRKPHGMFWAVRLAGQTLGFGELSARLVSAGAVALTALLAAAYGTKWFGIRHGWLAGVAYGLLPAVVPLARAAEIEALNNFFALLSGVLILDWSLHPRRGRLPRGLSIAGRSLALTAAIVGCVLAKGPAGLTVPVGALLGAVTAQRCWKPLHRPELWIALGMSVLLLLAFFGAVRDALGAFGGPPVTQSPAAFAFQPGTLLAVLALPLTAFATQLPATPALLTAFGHQAAREGQHDMRALLTARALAAAWFVAVVLFVAAGLSNVRYALPAAGLACLAVPWAAGGVHLAIRTPGFWAARAAVLGTPAAMIGLLALAAAARIVFIETRLDNKSGRTPGITLAEFLCQHTDRPVMLLADQLIEARPETLHYAQIHAREAFGRELRARWAAHWDPLKFNDAAPALPAPDPRYDTYLVLRNDPDDLGTAEADRFRAAGLLDGSAPIYTGSVYKYEFSVYRITP